MRRLQRSLAGAIHIVLVAGLAGTGTTGTASTAAAASAAPADLVAGVEWQSMGGPPGAGHVRQMVQATEPVHTLYALTDTNLYASSTRGDSWAPVDELEGRWISSIALQGEGLITCGQGVHLLDPAGLRQLRPEHCSAIAADAQHIVAAAGPPQPVTVSRLGASGAWEDVSPPASLFADLDGTGQTGRLVPGPIAIVRGAILMGVRTMVEEDTASDSGLFLWDPSDETWTQVDLPAPDRAVPTNLITDSRRPNRVIVTYGDPVLHEVRHPVSTMAFESKDGGRTWRSVSDSTRQVNAVTDVVDVGRDRYLLHPYDGFMLRLRGRQGAVVPMPRVKGITGPTYGLDTFLVDPRKPRYVYGVMGQSWELGLVRSTDRMKTWHKMDGTIVGSSPTIVVSHPDDPNVIMTSGNVIQESYATRNDGKSWKLFSPTSSGDELRIDPHDPQHVIVIDEMTTMFESSDGGRRFERLAGDFGAAKVLDLEIAPDDPSRFYVSLLGVGISRRHDEVWQHMSGSPDYAYDIEIDPDDSRVLFATYSPKKFEDHASVWRYRPDTGGRHPDAGWSEILRVDDSAGITSLRFDPSDRDTLYAGVTGPTGGIRVSHDHGERWSELNPALTFTTVQGHSQLEVVPGAQDTVFAGTWGGGSFRSADSGSEWTALDEDHTFSPTCIESWHADPDVVYACDRTAPKIHRSTDGGETWQEYFDFGGDHLTTTALAIHPADPDVVYAAAFRPPAAMFGSFYRIRDGEVEADLGGGLPRAVLDIALDESDPSQLYVSTHLHGLFGSADAGASWRRLDDRGTGLPRTGYLDVDVDPADSRTLYASSLCGPIPGYVIDPLRGALSRTEPYANIDPAARCGLYRSRDRGESWRLLLETLGEAKGVEAPAAHPGHLYVADGGGGVWASDDDGASWRQENEGMGTTSVTGVSAGRDRLYAGTQGSGVYVGTVAPDGSISWDGSDSPRVFVHRIQIEVDPRDGDRLYASAYPGGVLRSDDGGRTWSAKNFLTPSIRVVDPNVQGYYAMDIDPSRADTVWLGVYGKGLIVSHDGRDFGAPAEGTDGLLRGAHITSVEVDPRDGKHVLVGAEEGVFETTDRGKTWRRLNRGLGTTDVRAVRVSTAATKPFKADFKRGSEHGFTLEPGWRIAGGKLIGKGHTWARAGSPQWTDYSFTSTIKLDGGGVHVNARVNDKGRYFVGVLPNVLYLGKTTRNWRQHKVVAEADAAVGLRPHKVRVDVKGPRVRVFLDGRKVIDYRDARPHRSGYIAFEALEKPKVAIDDVKVKPASGGAKVYAGTAGYGLYGLDTSGRQWEHLGRVLGSGWWTPWERRMYQFSSLLFDPVEQDTIYYGHFPSGFFVSRDGGQSWRDASVGLGNDGMFSLAQHPDNAAVLFAGTYNGIAKSTDGGATWSDSSEGMPSEQWPYTVAIDPDDPAIMYASTKNGQNQGFCHRNSFCGVVMKSTDGGRTWRRIMSGLDPMSEFYTLLIYPPNHDVLFVSTSRGVFASLDAGEQWWPMDTGLPTTDNQVRDNVADNLALSGDDRYLFLGLVKHGAWRADISALADGAIE